MENRNADQGRERKNDHPPLLKSVYNLNPLLRPVRRNFWGRSKHGRHELSLKHKHGPVLTDN